VAASRRQLLGRIVGGDPRFASAPGLDREEVQARLDQGISPPREVARILAVRS